MAPPSSPQHIHTAAVTELNLQEERQVGHLQYPQLKCAPTGYWQSSLLECSPDR